MDAAEWHCIKDEEYVALPAFVKSERGHPPNKANELCFSYEITDKDKEQMKVDRQAVNALRK